MKLVFYSSFLNHHQVMVADELHKLLGDDFSFVATIPVVDSLLKGGEDFSKTRTYCIRAYESEDLHVYARKLALTAETCVFGARSTEYEVLRAKKLPHKLSFEMSERWLKRGWFNVFSPRFIRWYINYWLYIHRAKWYQLCCSAFTSSDDRKLGVFKNRCYKWGYFTKVETSGCENKVEAFTDVSTSEITPLLWCSRFLMWKHPELPILMAERLKKKGYQFHLDMYGTGECEEASKNLAESLELRDVVTFHGAVPNEQVHEAMRKAEIFLFTSDRYEGWGAVANECMTEGCVLVASDSIGSSPYLIQDGVNGFMFHSSMPYSSFGKYDMIALDSLCEKVEWLIDHPKERKQMQQNAIKSMSEIWSPVHAANSLLQLIDDINNDKCHIKNGPCSKA